MTPDNQTSARDAYEKWSAPRMSNIVPDHPGDAFEAGYAAALASRQQGEAVAWRALFNKAWVYSDGPENPQDGFDWKPLYLAPPALPAPALPVAQKQEGGEVEPCRYFDEGMRSYQRAIDRGEIPDPSAPAAAPALSEGLTEAARDVLDERERQKAVEGWTPEHDDEHDEGSLAYAAACYAVSAGWQSSPASDEPDEDKRISPHGDTPVSRLWPWPVRFWKPKDPRRDLVRAGALIVAEIERLDRLPAPTQPEAQA